MKTTLGDTIIDLIGLALLLIAILVMGMSGDRDE
jgi:hypothetical protein